MKLAKTMIAWNPGGEVKVGPYPDTESKLNGFAQTDDDFCTNMYERTDEERLILFFRAFHAMVVRDGVDPKVAHKACLKIDEYREIIASDIQG